GRSPVFGTDFPSCPQDKRTKIISREESKDAGFILLLIEEIYQYSRFVSLYNICKFQISKKITKSSVVHTGSRVPCPEGISPKPDALPVHQLQLIHARKGLVNVDDIRQLPANNLPDILYFACTGHDPDVGIEYV